MTIGCYGAFIVTALTAQNTKSFMACTPSLPEFVERQLRMRQAFGIITHILRPVAPTNPPAHNFNSVDEIPITAAIKDALKK